MNLFIQPPKKSKAEKAATTKIKKQNTKKAEEIISALKRKSIHEPNYASPLETTRKSISQSIKLVF